MFSLGSRLQNKAKAADPCNVSSLAGGIQSGLVNIETTENVIIKGFISNKEKNEYPKINWHFNGEQSYSFYKEFIFN